MAEVIECDARDVRRAPLIVTEDVELLDDLLRLCAAAGVRPEVGHGAAGGQRGLGRLGIGAARAGRGRCRGAAARGVPTAWRDLGWA